MSLPAAAGVALTMALAPPMPDAATALPILSEPAGCHDARAIDDLQRHYEIELQAAWDANGTDKAAAGTALDAVAGRYQPCWDSYLAKELVRVEALVAGASKKKRALLREQAAQYMDGLRNQPLDARERLERDGTVFIKPSPPPPGPPVR